MARRIKPAAKPAILEPQSHGGALLRSAGPGRPPNAVKRRALRVFDEAALPMLLDLVKDAAKDSDKIAAANVLRAAGLANSGVSVHRVLGLLNEHLAMCESRWGGDFDEFLMESRALWAKLLRT